MMRRSCGSAFRKYACASSRSMSRHLRRRTYPLDNGLLDGIVVPVVRAAPPRHRTQRPAPGTRTPRVARVEGEALHLALPRRAHPWPAPADVVEVGPLL